MVPWIFITGRLIHSSFSWLGMWIWISCGEQIFFKNLSLCSFFVWCHCLFWRNGFDVCALLFGLKWSLSPVTHSVPGCCEGSCVTRRGSGYRWLVIQSRVKPLGFAGGRVVKGLPLRSSPQLAAWQLSLRFHALLWHLAALSRDEIPCLAEIFGRLRVGWPGSQKKEKKKRRKIYEKKNYEV